MTNSYYARSNNADGDVNEQNHACFGKHWNEKYIADRCGHTNNTGKVIKGSKYSNLPVRNGF